MADPVWMLDTGGNTVPVDPATAQDAAAQGYTLASPEQVKDYQLQQKYGSTGQQVKTGLEGVRTWLDFRAV
jgi:hypothetical protein